MIEYAKLKTQLTDRQVENGAYRALREQDRQVRAQLGRLLWAQRQSEQRQAARQARQAELERVPVAAPAQLRDPQTHADEVACRREQARFQAAQTQDENSRRARQNKIAELEQ